MDLRSEPADSLSYLLGEVNRWGFCGDEISNRLNNMTPSIIDDVANLCPLLTLHSDSQRLEGRSHRGFRCPE